MCRKGAGLPNGQVPGHKAGGKPFRIQETGKQCPRNVDGFLPETRIARGKQAARAGPAEDRPGPAGPASETHENPALVPSTVCSATFWLQEHHSRTGKEERGVLPGWLLPLETLKLPREGCSKFPEQTQTVPGSQTKGHLLRPGQPEQVSRQEREGDRGENEFKFCWMDCLC